MATQKHIRKKSARTAKPTPADKLAAANRRADEAEATVTHLRAKIEQLPAPRYTLTRERVDAALSLADTLVDLLDEVIYAEADERQCPICDGDLVSKQHDVDWGDGGGCPVLIYERERAESAR